MPTEPEKAARLDTLARWEHPGPGSYYDALGDLSKSPHLVRGPELNTDPLIPVRGTSMPGFVWDQGGYSRLRLTWQGGLRPAQMVYENIDPDGKYVVRINGRGEMALYVNQKKVEPAADTEKPPASGESEPAAARALRSRIRPQFTEFPIPQELLKERRLVLDWGDPKEPRTPGLRFGPIVAEVWLLKKS